MDSSKFATSSGAVVCELSEVDILITDSDISAESAEMIRSAGIKLVIAD